MNRIGAAVALTMVMVLGLLFFGQGSGGGEGERASVLGARIQPRPAATSTAVVFVAQAGTESAPTAVPTKVADQGVEVTVPPTPTPDTAPINAAPAVVGAPVVFGLTEEGLSGPNVIRPGLQTWAFVSKSDAALSVGVFEATADRATLRLDGAGLVASTGAIAGRGAMNWPVELAPGDYWRATFDAEGTLLAVEPVTIVT